eukprot:scaffold34075_cov32-Tisochrysis_lutea.AAC.2
MVHARLERVHLVDPIYGEQATCRAGNELHEAGMAAQLLWRVGKTAKVVVCGASLVKVGRDYRIIGVVPDSYVYKQFEVDPVPAARVDLDKPGAVSSGLKLDVAWTPTPGKRVERRLGICNE